MSASLFSSVDKNLLSEKIAAQILLLIKERRLNPGEKLPPERELAATLQVSRTALREAFRALSMIGAIDSRQGDGTYVTALEPELLFDHLDYVVALSESTYENLFEARRVLETGIIMDAARRISDAEIAALEQVLRGMEDLDPGRYAGFLEADLEFHELIVKAARNPIYQSPYFTSIRRLGRISRLSSEPVPGLQDQSLPDHRRIVAALRTRDPEQARAAMLEHLEHVADLLHRLNPAGGQPAGV